MTTKRKKPFGKNTGSLNREIGRAASRLDRRKMNVKALGLALGSRVQSGCTSASGLWIAGCTGFLLAEWINRPVDKTPRDDAKGSEPPARPETEMMLKAAPLVKLAMELKALWEKGASQSTSPREKPEGP